MNRNAKKLTSRIISTVMALTLIIALLPAAFAEDTATTDKEITIPNVFPFYLNGLAFDADDDGDRDDIGYYSTSGKADYAANPEGITYSIGNGNVQFYATNSSKEIKTKWNSSTSQLKLGAGEFTAFKLKGIASGKYRASLVRTYSNGDMAKIYIIPLPEEATDYDDTTTTAAVNYAKTLIESTTPVMNNCDFSLGVEKDGGRFYGEFEATDTGEYLFVIRRNTDREENGAGTFVGINFNPVALLLDPIETVNYGVFTSATDCADDISVTVDGTAGNTTGELYEGSTLTATAKDEADGFTFRYWVLGSAATGRYYSSEKSVTVNPYANIALTAIYTEDNDDAKVVDLFNYNGEFLQTLTDLSGLGDVKPTMIGHTFAGKWLIDENTELTSETILTAPVTQAVAQYTKNATYEAENENNGSTYGWLRNGNLVTYDEDYTFLTWLNETNSITMNEKEVTHKAPLAVLEESGGAYMLEYDEGDYTIEEAGILFGRSAEVDVKSAYSKAKVKDIKAHGQFTVAPMENGTENMQTYARGYVMYKDRNSNIKVVYTDAID